MDKFHPFKELIQATMRKLLVLDYGCRAASLIVDKLYNLGREAPLVSPLYEPEDLPIGVILSGGPQSVYQPDSLKLPLWLLAPEAEKIPVLGICYGMQLLANLGGKVAPIKNRLPFEEESGLVKVMLDMPSTILTESGSYWMNHRDEVVSLSPDWNITARSDNGIIAAISHRSLPRWGVQFHPEHTENTVLSKFLAFIRE